MSSSAKDLPIVSIGIPTYNQEEFIVQAIQSALLQGYPNLEIIVSDDNSTDGTFGVIRPFLSDKRLFYFKNETNLGRVANYKKILYERVRGEWYLNLDGDDFLTDNDFIQKAIDVIVDNPQVVLVQGLCQVEDKLGNRKEVAHAQINSVQIINGKNFLLSYPERYNIQHLAALYDRRKAMEIDFYRSNTLRSDYESLLRLALRGDVALYRKPVGIWREHGFNETWSLNKEKLTEEKKVYDAVAVDASTYIDNRLLRNWVIKCKENIDYYYLESYIKRSPSFGNWTLLREYFRFSFTYFKIFIKYLLYSSRIYKDS